MPLHTEPSAESRADAEKFLRIPRWVVYSQVTLLLLLPLTCFLLGMAAAVLARPDSPANAKRQACSISGKLQGVTGEPTAGVVLLLPLEREPEARLNPATLHPSSFQPLQNPAILTIQQLGGAVSRTSEQGNFHLDVQGPGRFLLVAIGQTPWPQGTPPPSLSKAVTAELSRYFLPLESLYSGHPLQTLIIRADGQSLELNEVRFGD